MDVTACTVVWKISDIGVLNLPVFRNVPGCFQFVDCFQML
jgi:hypothetical protein